MNLLAATALACLAIGAHAQDPAPGWMAYAEGTNPDGGIVTKVDMKWRVPDDPREGGAFFSPWYGIETSDNLNLFQPVNPWEGENWAGYVEYFQWEPEHNENSDSFEVSAGDVLHATVKFNPSAQEYTAVHRNLNNGQSVTKTIGVQQNGDGSYKKYTILYVVMEKSQWSCAQYPANGKVTFFDIAVEYDNKPVDPSWRTSYVDDNCDCRAHLEGSNVTITWSTDDNAVRSTSLAPALQTLPGMHPHTSLRQTSEASVSVA